MKLPRDLSGDDLVRILCREFGYRVVHRRGSHIVLETEEPSHHRIAVPSHKSLRVGTLRAIFRSVALHKRLTRQQLLKFF